MTFPQTDFPHWAQTALAESSWEGFIDVDGAWIHYITWGDVTKPPLVLIHGNAACGEWWRFIAPFLAEDYYVIAPDLAGMGDSSHTGRYERERYAQQVVTVAQTLAPGRKPLLVGHSLGGMVAILAGNAYGEQLAGIIVVDWPPQEPELKDPSPFDLANPQPRIYPDRDSALARFKVVPKQDVNCAFYLQHIAQHSIKAEDGGATATYAGRLWIPGNGQGLHADYEDSPRLVAHYLDALLDGADPRGLRQTFIASGPDVLDDLAARSQVQFTSAGRHPDSVVASGAAKTGRAAYHAASQAFARSVAPSYRGVNPQPTSTFQHV